jgi:protein SCO1/2
MARTALACLASLLLAWGCARWLTHDFQVWTSEGARRLEVALEPVAAPPTLMAGPASQGQTLHQLLAQERAVTIVDFMYTRCLSVCSALGTAFQQLQQEIQQPAAGSPPAPLRLLSISFDATHDDAATLARYAAKLQADPRIWRFARVAQPADNAALLRRYQVTVIPDGLGGFEHNAALLVVDAQGRLVRVFDYAELDTALAYARQVASRGAGS